MWWAYQAWVWNEKAEAVDMIEHIARRYVDNEDQRTDVKTEQDEAAASSSNRAGKEEDNGTSDT